MVVLGDSKSQLSEVRELVRDRLNLDRLTLHPCKAHIVPVKDGLDLLGYHVFPKQRRLRNDNGWRFIRKLRRFGKAYANGTMDWDDFNPSVQSWIGHAAHADTMGLRESIFSQIVFSRGAGHTAAGG